MRQDTVERMRSLYEFRRRRFAARSAGQTENSEEDGDYEERSVAYQRLKRELLDAERTELLRLRNQDRLSDETRRRIERDLDLKTRAVRFSTATWSTLIRRFPTAIDSREDRTAMAGAK